MALNSNLNWNIGLLKKAAFPTADLKAYLKGDIVESDGLYYFKNSKGDDKQIVDSLDVEVTAANQKLELTASANVLNIQENKVNKYCFENVQLNSSDSDSNIRKYALYSCRGYDASNPGWLISFNNKEIKLSISDGSMVQVVSTGLTMPDDYVNLVCVTIDTISNTVRVDVDDNYYQTTLTASGDKTNNTTIAMSGDVGFSPLYRIGRFYVLNDDNLVFDLPFATNMLDASFKCYYWDLVSGQQFRDTFYPPVTRTGLKPYNLLNGFELYQRSGVDGFVPIKTNGEKITPTISGFTKIDDYSAGSWHNYAESKIKLNESTTIDVDDLTKEPPTQYFAKVEDNKIYEMLLYSEEQTGNDLQRILKYLGILSLYAPLYYIFSNTLLNGESVVSGLTRLYL